MNIHTFVGWGMGIIGIFGIAACGASDAGDSKSQSPLVGDEERESVIDFVTYNDKAAPGYSAAAWFMRGRTYGPGRKETSVKEGSCTITTWEYVDREDPEHPPVMISAGEIALSGAKIAPNSVMKHDDRNFYPYFYGRELLWTGGEDIRIAATGSPDGVGAFDSTVKAPSLITVTQPSWDVEGLTIDRSKNLEVAWTRLGAASGTVTVVVEGIAEGFQHGVSVACEYPASSDAAVVPASVLQAIPSDSHGSILIETTERQTVPASSWKVNLRLRGGGTQSNGRNSSGPVDFQ